MNSQRRVRPKPARQRHKSSIRTKARAAYIEVALGAALNDPEMRPHVVRFGELFPERRAADVTVQQLRRALDARHPETGRGLRARLSSETRVEKGRRLSNRVRGWDACLSVDKTISVAALVLGDRTLLEEAIEAMQHAGRRLARLIDRRLRRDGQNRTVESGVGLAFFIPETAGRFGQPQLHAHVVFANLTRFEDDGRQRFAAVHFQRIAQQALAVQRKMNIRLYQRLVGLGYAVEYTQGTCRLPQVSKELCQRFSPAIAQMDATAGKWKGKRKRSSQRAAQGRDRFYLFRRPDKLIRPVAEWRAAWQAGLRPAELRGHIDAYRAGRLAQVSDPESDGAERPEVQSVAALTVAVSEPSWPAREAAADTAEGDDDALLPFRQLVSAFRQTAGREFPAARRPHAVEIVYECPDAVPQLVEHTQAIRSALRFIVPGAVVHQRFSSGSQHTFTAVGTAAADAGLVRLIAQAGAALQIEIDRSEAKADWVELGRWLREALANAPAAVVDAGAISSTGPKTNGGPVVPSAPQVPPPPKGAAVARPVHNSTRLPVPAPAEGPDVEVDIDHAP